jgi:hypothetical protein
MVPGWIFHGREVAVGADGGQDDLLPGFPYVQSEQKCPEAPESGGGP